MKGIIGHDIFSNLQDLNVWYSGYNGKIEIISIQYEIRSTYEVHHVYYKVTT